jgi:hypothetical protein
VNEEEPRPITADDKALVVRQAQPEPDEIAEYVPLNPEQVEAAMYRCSMRIARGVRIVSDAEAKFKELDRAYDKAYAQAFIDYEGPQTEKKFGATLATMAEREARDIAYQAFQYVKRLSEGLENELRTLQSINKSVLAMFSATTGYGS